MGALGEALRVERESRGLSLAGLEQLTKIRARHLAALEAGDWSLLPATVYVRGYVHLCASALGLDVSEMLALFDKEKPRYEPTGVQPEVPRLRTSVGITGRTVLAVFLVLVLVAVGYYYYQQFATFAAGSPSRPVGSVPTVGGTPQAGLVPAVPTPGLPVTPVAIPTVAPSPSPTAIQGVHIEAKVVQRTWLCVTVDDQPVYTRTADPGIQLRWDGADKIFMRTGNAGGVEITFNGKPQGTLGAPGEVKNLEWTATSLGAPRTVTPAAGEPYVNPCLRL